MDDCEIGDSIKCYRRCNGMKKRKKNATNSLEALQELGKKYGVQVTDMAKRGIRAIGILGGVRRRDQEPSRNGSPSTDAGRLSPNEGSGAGRRLQ